MITAAQCVLDIDPGAMNCRRRAARAVGIVFSEIDELLLEFSCEAGAGEALFVKEMTEVAVSDVIGSVAVTILSIATGFDELFDNFDGLFVGHSW